MRFLGGLLLFALMLEEAFTFGESYLLSIQNQGSLFFEVPCEIVVLEAIGGGRSQRLKQSNTSPVEFNEEIWHFQDPGSGHFRVWAEMARPWVTSLREISQGSE